MFELPEYVTLADQLNAAVRGKRVSGGTLGNAPHTFVWYNVSREAFSYVVTNRVVGTARARGKWLFVPLAESESLRGSASVSASVATEPLLLFGECGGELRYLNPGEPLPRKHHLSLSFHDGSSLYARTSMWGAYEVHTEGSEQHRDGVRGMRPTPVDDAFSFDYFLDLLTTVQAEKRRSVKGVLTQEALIPGIGNALAQDIMWAAGLYPKRPVASLNTEERRRLYDAVLSTVHAAIEGGGRDDEVNLFGVPGGYRRRMDKRAVGAPCERCGTPVEAFQYLGGRCCICPSCQPVVC